MKSITFLQNIIPPYRVDLFNKLEELSKGTDLDFRVAFMRRSKKGRQWEVNLSDLNFEYILGKGIYFKIGFYHFHFNPFLLIKLVKSKNEIILGGSWNNFNVFILILLKRAGLLNKKLHIWTEANYLTKGAQRRSWLKSTIRKYIFDTIDGYYLVPGEMAKITLQKWDIEVNPSRFIYFPNLINSKKFKGGIKQKESSVKPIFLIVARLEEEDKGILNFMEAIGISSLRQIELKIAGDGKSKRLYQQFITENRLEGHINLLGHISEQEVRKYLNISDVFVLPSFSDPSPLSIVEAAFMQKPLLVSDRCGNHFELVRDEYNGKIFNPHNEKEIKNAFKFMLVNRNDYKEMGRRSLEIAKEKFNEASIINDMINKIS